MAKTRDWTEILIRRGVIGPDQLKEAQRAGGTVEESLVKLGYAEADDIMKAKAEQHGLPFIELREIEIPTSVIELVPESLARENIVMPLAQGNGTIKVIMHDPLGFETIEKLRFVLNREIEVALRRKKQSSRPSINTMGLPAARPNRSTRCSRSSLTLPSILRRIPVQEPSPVPPTPWKKATPRSSSWCI